MSSSTLPLQQESLCACAAAGINKSAKKARKTSLILIEFLITTALSSTRQEKTGLEETCLEKRIEKLIQHNYTCIMVQIGDNESLGRESRYRRRTKPRFLCRMVRGVQRQGSFPFFARTISCWRLRGPADRLGARCSGTGPRARPDSDRLVHRSDRGVQCASHHNHHP